MCRNVFIGTLGYFYIPLLLLLVLVNIVHLIF